MGLFGKKKVPKELPPLKFPRIEEFPKYEPLTEIPRIKQAVSQDLDIPIRKPAIPKFLNLEEMPQEPITKPEKRGKTLFVKIEDYERAMKTLAEIRSKLEETNKILEKLNSIKSEEDNEIEKFKSDIESLKEKFLDIDKTLFE